MTSRNEGRAEGPTLNTHIRSIAHWELARLRHVGETRVCLGVAAISFSIGCCVDAILAHPFNVNRSTCAARAMMPTPPTDCPITGFCGLGSKKMRADQEKKTVLTVMDYDNYSFVYFYILERAWKIAHPPTCGIQVAR